MSKIVPMHSYLLTPIKKSNQKAQNFHIFRIEFPQSLNLQVTGNNRFTPWLTLAGPSHLKIVTECSYKSNQKLDKSSQNTRNISSNQYRSNQKTQYTQYIHSKILLSCMFRFAPLLVLFRFAPRPALSSVRSADSSVSPVTPGPLSWPPCSA